MTTRSSALFAGTIPLGVLATLYTVPSNQTVILKSVYTWTPAAAPDVFSVGVQRPGIATIYVQRNLSIPADTTAEWNGWLVLVPGDLLVAGCANGNVNFWLSGAKLFGVA